MVAKNELEAYDRDKESKRKVDRRTAPFKASFGDHSKYPDKNTEQGEQLQDCKRPAPAGADGERRPEEEGKEGDATQVVQTLDGRARDHLPQTTRRQYQLYGLLPAGCWPADSGLLLLIWF
jgi:hypothetical protein